MKLYQIIIIITLVVNCKNPAEKPDQKMDMESKNTLFFVGTYTNAKSEGIYTYSLSDSGKIKKVKLAAKTENPSFLTKSVDGDYLLAVNELNTVNGGGTVESYKILGDSLQFINKQPSGGAHPCFVTSNENGYVLTANYSSGTVGLLKMTTSGELSELLDIQDHNTENTPKNDKNARAHSAYFTHINNFMSADLGTNQLWFSTIDDEKNSIEPKGQQTLLIRGENPGPRHIAFHPTKNWLYVINELNSTITTVIRDKDVNYDVIGSVSTLPEDFKGESFCADIHISDDGKFLYGSNRGHNSIAIFEIDQESGVMTSIGFEPVKGDWPRNFALSPDDNFLLVANQRSENIVSFKRDKATGLLTFIHDVEVPSPVCILF